MCITNCALTQSLSTSSPKNTLQMQKQYLQKVCLHGSMTISKYFAHWHQLNNYLALFPPAQKNGTKAQG